MQQTHMYPASRSSVKTPRPQQARCRIPCLEGGWLSVRGSQTAVIALVKILCPGGTFRDLRKVRP